MRTFMKTLYRSLVTAAIAALFTTALFAADPPAKAPAAPAVAPVLAEHDALAITILLRKIDHDQIVIDQASVAQKDQQQAQDALRALVARVSPAGWHLVEPNPGELAFAKNDTPPVVPVQPPKPTATK